MQINMDINIIYDLVHEQGEWLSPRQLEALNDAMSALKTVRDADLYKDVSRETIIGTEILKLAHHDCKSHPCNDCPYLDNTKWAGYCLSAQASKLVDFIENFIKKEKEND